MGIDIGIAKITGTGTDNSAGSSVRLDTDRKQNSSTGLIVDPVEKKQDAPPKEIDDLASEVQIQLKRLNTELRLEVDRDSTEIIIKVVDKETDKVIKQIPSRELQEIRERMEALIGVLYNSKT